MKCQQKFFKCSHCGNLLGLIDNKNVPMMCCGEAMSELVPNTAEASTEKHLPVAVFSGDVLNVAVGSAPHPMESEHCITFIYAETERGGQRKCLNPGEDPSVSFSFCNDKPVAVYAYCNLHGLWKTDM